ncbi:hypothetical protein [Nocardioides flavescens]|uniref:Uncharacterized protein n=1 Tax=Nocardioides flavescens TaxID=2691959 RepID=A0A6L7EP85_9ACTN|nr:hypothetical protein [Nocardioides flavescens]MXG88420.1 hypothetical protein [Nocardioides flavescens]
MLKNIEALAPQYEDGLTREEKHELLGVLSEYFTIHESPLTALDVITPCTPKQSSALELELDDVRYSATLDETTTAIGTSHTRYAQWALRHLMTRWEFAGWLVSANGYLDALEPVRATSARDFMRAVWAERHAADMA